MRVLLTGAFGNIGLTTLNALLDAGHQVRCFDVESPLTLKTMESFARHMNGEKRSRCEIVWGDLRTYSLAALTKDVDAVVHLAAILPPVSESNEELARQVNVDATEGLLRATEAMSPGARFIFASSVGVYGYQKSDSAPKTSADPVNPVNAYGRQKVRAEELVKKSKLRWLIVRLGVCFDSKSALQVSLATMKMQLAVQPDARLEQIHPKDVALALTNAISAEGIDGKVLLLGGGPACRTTSGDLFRTIFAVVGLEVPQAIFGTETFYGEWMDTTESQRLLAYQTHSLADTVRELEGKLRIVKWLLLPFRPLVPLVLTRLFRPPSVPSAVDQQSMVSERPGGRR